MSNAASHASAFYRDVAKNKKLWTIKDEEGFPAPENPSGRRSLPFWSTLSRAQKIIKNVPAYEGFEPFEISFEEFCRKWVKELEEDGLLVGVNWSGKYARGHDREPRGVMESVQYVINSTEQ